jgi:hypothetical protein
MESAPESSRIVFMDYDSKKKKTISSRKQLMRVIMYIDKSPAIIMGLQARWSQQHFPASPPLHFTIIIISPAIIPTALN